MATYCPYCMSPVSPGQPCPNCGADPTDYHPSSHHFPLGLLLRDRYLVGKVLGEGGFGITYLGLDTTLERRVAIKEYFPNVFVHRESSVSLGVTCYAGEKQTLYEKGRDQFLQEARVMARFDDCPEIVQVLDFFPANNTAYIVMELLTGNTLRAFLAQQQRIPAKHLFEMMEPLLRTMNAVHGAGIIHRDISPDNIMLLDNGQVKLLDFGCARDVDKEHTMTVMLKHGYAPLEQYTGYNQGPWTDIYGLCATFYRCLTGQTPPRALERIAQDPLIPPNRLGAALTPEHEEALMRGLAVEPKNRWQSIAGLYAALYGTVIKVVPWLPEEQEAERITEPETKTSAETEYIFSNREPKPEPKAAAILEPKPEPKLETVLAPVQIPEVKSEPEEKSKPLSSARNKKLWLGVAACCLVLLAVFVYRGIRSAKATVFTGESSTISAGRYHIVGLKSDGAVVAVGNNEYGQCDVDNLTDIVAISAGDMHTVGLKSDGTVIAVGNNDYGQCDVGDWRDIVAISAGYLHTIGLKSDGTVVSTGGNVPDSMIDVGDWRDIVVISAGALHTVGLKSDGTVIAVGNNDYGQCDVGDWRDIVAISAGFYHTVGLKSDGTVVTVGSNEYGQCDVGGWTDIVAISAEATHTVGLKSGGTMVAAGFEDYGNLGTDIVAISAAVYHVVVLRSDGTVNMAGSAWFNEFDAEDWTDIQIPA